nr:RagB/SusD family nutrient uptake outer membrane protein [Mucilaginibacter sp. L294]
MKFNSYIYRIGLILILAVSVSGCKKYLDEKNKSGFDKDNYFQNEGQARTFVNGIYTSLYMFQNGDAYGESPFITMELFAGHTTSLGQSVNNGNVINQRTDAVNPGFETVWKNSYAAIANANLALERIPGIDMPEATKTGLLSQVYFLRAFFYYHLVRLYGDVPLITASQTLKSPDLYPPRSPVADVYNLIISDLIAAKGSGTISGSQANSDGHVTLGAIKTLLASVYLTTAGYPLQKTENYAKAAAEAKDVIPAYTLFTDYAFLHDNAHKNQGELIFQSNYLVGVKENAIPQLTVPFNLPVGAYGDHLGAMIPTNAFVASYEPGDLRAQERQFYFSSYPQSDAPAVTVIFGVHALYKYFHLESATKGSAQEGKSDENWTFLRLPEAMLIYAEAQNEADGSPNQYSIDQLTAIRTRAHLTTPTSFTQAAFREAVWRERYHELAYENKAYFDIQRTHKIFKTSDGSFGDATSTANEQGVTMIEQYYLWPIPQREISTNPQLKGAQNPGWN